MWYFISWSCWQTPEPEGTGQSPIWADYAAFARQKELVPDASYLVMRAKNGWI